MSKNTWLRHALTYGSFPVIFGGSIAAGLYGFDLGVSRPLLVSAVVFVAALCIILLERVHPHEPRWNRSHGDVRTDFLHGLITMIALPELLRAALFGALFAGSSWLTSQLGFDLWPTTWPLLAQAALAMILTEFPYYFWHRIQHENAYLWRLHAVHHGAPRLYWLNAARFHPLDAVGGYLFQMPVLILLGAPDSVLGMFLIFTGVHGLMQHANIQMRLGPLNWIFSMAELHRWHHSRTLEEANSNYGGNIILYDLIFGTRFLPADREPPREIGISDMPTFPSGYLDHLASPFRWAAVQAEYGVSDTRGPDTSSDVRPAR